MNGKQSSDINLIKNLLNNFLRQFGGYFPSRNVLQLKETLKVWHGVPQDTVYCIIPNFASTLLRLHTVKSRAAHCRNYIPYIYWIPVVFVTFFVFICFHIWHVEDPYLHEISAFELFFQLFGIIFTSYEYFVSTKSKVRNRWNFFFVALIFVKQFTQLMGQPS